MTAAFSNQASGAHRAPLQAERRVAKMKREHQGQASVYEEYLELDEVGPNGVRPPGERSSPPRLDRRQFLQLLGGGIIVCFTIPDSLALQERERRRGMGQELPEDFNAFLRIGEDGRVSGFSGKVEYGQGIITSLAQMLAEELDVPLESVDMVLGDTELCPWDRGTFGSMTTRSFGPAFRAAAAEAKAVLVELAAEQLQVPKERLKTKAGVVYEAGGQRRVSYAELAKGQHQRDPRRNQDHVSQEEPQTHAPRLFAQIAEVGYPPDQPVGNIRPRQHQRAEP